MTRFNKMKATDTKVKEVVGRPTPFNLKRLSTRGGSEQIARAYLSGELINLPIAEEFLENEAILCAEGSESDPLNQDKS